MPHRQALQGCWNRVLATAVSALLVVTAACQPRDSELSPTDPPPSVILISPDSLRADRLRPWNPDAPATPNLRRLRESALTYTNAWATAPWTAPAMVSVMTGLYPPSHGVVYRDDTTPRDMSTLPRLLEQRGYAIGNFTFFSTISYFRNLGLGPAARGLREDRVAEAFASWLTELDDDEPFFAWLHLLETHLPYGATGYRATQVSVPGSSGLEASQTDGTVPLGSVEFAEGDREKLLELYDQDVQAMDAALGRILEALQSHGRAENTWVVFVADHGEELLDSEHDPPWVGHASTAVEARLLPQTLHVPLLIAGPGVAGGRSFDALVQPVDILATLSEALELPLANEIDGERLPGFQRRSRWSLPRWFASSADGRSAVFFDSSPGGNLTPRELRGVRVQGASDGVCLLSRTLGGEVTSERFEGACTDARRAQLTSDLARWQRQQTTRRLETMDRPLRAPSREQTDAWPVALELVQPTTPRMRWSDSSGQISLAWRRRDSPPETEAPTARRPRAQPAEPFLLEYEMTGSTVANWLGDLQGAFAVEGNAVTFGPVPRGFWNDIAAYSPIRIRLLDPEAQVRSPWYEYAVEPTSVD